MSEKDERWTLRKVGVLHSLALALAQGGEHAMAEDKLVEAIRQLQELDGVDPDAESCEHKVTAALGRNGWAWLASGGLFRLVHTSAKLVQSQACVAAD